MLSQSSAPAAATAIRPEITTPDSVATDQKAGGSSPSERAQLTGPSQTKMSFLALDSSVFEGSSQLIRPSNVRRKKKTGQQANLPLLGSLDGSPGPLPMHSRCG